MRRTLLLVAAIAACVIASKVVLENLLGLSLEPVVMAWIENPGTGAAVLIVGLLAVDVFLPVPSSLVMVLSGAAFGVWWGAALALVGSIAGEWLGFELVRRYGHGMAARLVGDADLQQLRGFFARHGALAIVISRPLPVLMETMSVVAGLSTMPRSTFLLASLAGTVPIVVVYAYAGAVSRELDSIVPAVVILVAMAAAGFAWYRARIAPATVRPSPSSAALPDSRPADRPPSPGCRS